MYQNNFSKFFQECETDLYKHIIKCHSNTTQTTAENADDIREYLSLVCEINEDDYFTKNRFNIESLEDAIECFSELADYLHFVNAKDIASYKANKAIAQNEDDINDYLVDFDKIALQQENIYESYFDCIKTLEKLNAQMQFIQQKWKKYLSARQKCSEDVVELQRIKDLQQ